MPLLVEQTGSNGIWEVKWMWMPVFLASNRELLKEVDQHLNQLFAGQDIPKSGVLDKAVINFICKKFPMQGLREALESIQKIDPTIRMHLVEEMIPQEQFGMPSSDSKKLQKEADPL